MSVLKYWDQTSGSYKILSGPPGPTGISYVVVASTPPDQNNPIIAPPAGLLFADTSVPDPVVYTYLPVTGGTLSSNTNPLLTLTGGSGLWTGIRFNMSASGYGAWLGSFMGGNERWEIDFGNGATETGSNVGSDFQITRFTDAGAFIDNALVITRSNGNVTMSQDLYVNGGSAVVNGPASQNANVLINKPASGQSAFLAGYTNNSIRWGVIVGTNTAESGSNAGSNFQVEAYSDAGAFLGAPLSITRSGGVVSVNGYGATLFTGGATGNASFVLNKAAATNTNVITSFTNNSQRWQMLIGNATAESGSNLGSDFAVSSYSDAGALLGTPLMIRRADGFAAIHGNGATVTNPYGITPGYASLTLNKTTGNVANMVTGARNGSRRWEMYLGDYSPESTGNAGSIFMLTMYDDSATLISSPILIYRNGGGVMLQGTQTNDNVPAGRVGEVISSVVSGSPGVTLTSATQTSITSISLTAGDWSVSGEVWVTVGTGGATYVNGAINQGSAVLPAIAVGAARAGYATAFTASQPAIVSLAATRISLAATTTVFLVAYVIFPSGTTVGYGKIEARRMR